MNKTSPPPISANFKRQINDQNKRMDTDSNNHINIHHSRFNDDDYHRQKS